MATDLFRDLERMMTTNRPAGSAMPMDLVRDGDRYVASFDLPGVDADKIDIDVDDRTVTIRAERPARSGEVKWLAKERPTGTFARQLTLGYAVAIDKITADYSDGVLTLTFPVTEESKPRKISVNTKTIDA